MAHRAAPTAILQAAISKFEERSDGVSGLPQFMAAPRFAGARPGYYFGRGASGVGYYLDSKQAAPAEGEADDDAGAAAAAAARARARHVDAGELLREAEEAAGDAGMEMLDAKGLKRLTLQLERKYNSNLEARMRYADQPDKFMESEADLDEAVKALLVVASAPDLYPELVANTSALQTLLALLNHENSDVAADAVEVLQELTDSDAVEDAEEEAEVLVDALLEADALQLLVHRLSAFDEKASSEEASAVYNILAIIENMIDLKPSVAEDVVEQTKLMKWLLGRLRPRDTDSNKQYASEILAILVQQSDANKRKLAASGGMDAVLQAIAPYRNRDPESTEEEELLENLVDVLASCLLLEENKSVFVEAEGVELLLLILRGKRLARTSALKCLDFATTRCPPACDRVVDQAGLKTLFAIFMGKLKVPKKKRDEASTAGEEEERTVSVIASLLLNCSKQSRRDRVAAKFVEAEFEKCDRLMEVYLRYEGRVAAEEARLAEAEEEQEEDVLLARMDAGLYTLQQCALIVGALWLVGDVGVRKRVLRLLHQQSHTVGSLRSVLLEYRANLGDDGPGGAEERARQVERATQMLLAMGHDPAEDEAAAKEAAAAAGGAANGGAAEGGGAAAAAAAPAAEGDDMELEEAEEGGKGGKAAAPAVPAEADMDVEEGEEKPPQPREERRGGEGERRRSRSRSKERRKEKERRRSRSRDKKRGSSRERRKERSRSRDREGRRRSDRSRSVERRTRDQRSRSPRGRR
ncbi:beta-catenin 1 [Micractinium conductrix]|uniref:Beta-catenin 1 n=1 Tax=Micractinium conductrix TaxID=554055 RepID=A0A2P6VIS5_9CHLO|nr:beta-catenin 1 [Micractinium conductrix]|eukprot:PSC73978.1 beta-catenin 1 [Micractinium conductrix]